MLAHISREWALSTQQTEENYLDWKPQTTENYFDGKLGTQETKENYFDGKLGTQQTEENCLDWKQQTMENYFDGKLASDRTGKINARWGFRISCDFFRESGGDADDPARRPARQTEPGNPMEVAPQVESDVDQLPRSQDFSQCLRDLHLLQTPLRVAFQEVFDFLPDEVFDPSTQPTDYADDKVTSVLNSPLPLPATSPLNHPDCNDEPPVISSSQTQTQLSSGSLEVSPPRVTCQS
ncbi:hypothetical protein PSHT_03814 [Puccinia striiformis]|uniref:Uncharacterized protein n=1 Tax=Puccinia striiformis TaxID=27350 RepID=A0A2S4WEJ2_9BASI|nr:hypothetical protein PSHT_03814 [Puccinia striiformis]